MATEGFAKDQGSQDRSCEVEMPGTCLQLLRACTIFEQPSKHIYKPYSCIFARVKLIFFFFFFF